ncbi:MAG: glycosyltransferase family 2 protein [Nitrospinae bacterium]|nr:glycosyltransferase family 2 protein [Nitrospinota bacterium]
MISVIILAHNKVDMTRECLSSLSRSSCATDMEVILADNASTDETTQLGGEFGGQFGKFVYLRNDDNLTFSIANNKAAARAKGEMLLFLNNDVTVGSDSVAAMAEAFSTDKTIGMAGAKLVFPGSERVQHAGIVPMLWGYASNYGSGGMSEDARFNSQKEMFAVTGAMLMARRNVFEGVKGFDEGFVWGYEDVDLCLKAAAYGAGVVYVPRAESVHHESATMKDSGKHGHLRANYHLYRNKWDHLLVPRERGTVAALKKDGVRRVVVFGTGQAARGLFAILTENGISVVGFASSTPHDSLTSTFLDRPVYLLDEMEGVEYDRMIIGSQFYFEIESKFNEKTIFPVV